MRRMDKKARRIDRAQNLIIALLTLSFVLLLLQTPLFGDAQNGTLSATVRGWFSGTQSTVSTEEDVLTALSVPVRIVHTNDFLRSGADALTTTDSAFEEAGSFLGEAIGSAHGISSAAESVFLSALEGAGIYFDFADELPLEVLAARLGVQSPTTRELNVRRCLVSIGDADSALLYLQDSEQGVFCFSTAVSAAEMRDYLESQNGGSVDFAFSLGEDYASLSPYTLLFAAPETRSELSAANALGDYSAEELLRRAEFNPHTQDWYTESSGTVVYIEGQRKLYLHPDGTLSYNGAAAESGSLFAVTAADPAHPTRTELCAAARSLVGTLTQGRLGDAALYLAGMESDEDGATVFFDYMALGTPIRFADGAHAAEVRIEHGSVTAFTLRVRRYTLTERSSLLLPISLARAVAQRYPNCELTAAYIDSYADTVSASWIAG